MQIPNIAYSHLNPDIHFNTQSAIQSAIQSDLTNIPGLQSMVPCSLFNQPTPTSPTSPTPTTPNNKENTNG